jgi:hypothetical protein
MQCIFIDGYLETSIFVLYATVSAPRSPQKATDWSGIESSKPSKEIKLSWYQSIDIHCIVMNVNFDGGLSISVLINMQLFTKNWGSKTISYQKSSNFQNLLDFMSSVQ